MAESLVEILDRVDAALAKAGGLVPEGVLDPAARSARRARNRLRFPEDLVIVALAGGTGTGKSALFNALIDREDAEVGGLRPTTSIPMVSLPRSTGSRFDSYLEEFGVVNRVAHDEPDWLVLIDLPDTDSVEVDHRVTVENLLPKVDIVIWVADVEKYRDASLHQGFLSQLVGYERQFLFVLNQVDRIPMTEVPALVADYESALHADGFASPRVLEVAARPPIGPQRVESLRDELAQRVTGSVSGKVVADLRSALDTITREVGASASGFEETWPDARDSALEKVMAGEAVDASRDLVGYFADLSERLAGKAADTALGIAAHIGEDLAEAIGGAETQSEDGSRWRFWQRPDLPDLEPDRLRQHLDRIATTQMGPVLRARAETIAELTSISIDLTSLE